ncbi:MAG: NADH-quinone oxidoreductase subunit N [SAR202 cluster bacterium]|nr:NADH-quinone oxidoreductase subunit N [SAR202 cluster bacterium]
MSVHDFYVISPYLAMAGAGLLVILLDLVLPKKSLLPYFAFAALAGPFVLSLIQFYDISESTNLLQGSGVFSTDEPSVLLGALSVDRFALFFNFLIIGATALVVLSSTDYVKNLERFQGEYFGLILFSATGMMLLAAATELITIYISLELTTLPLAALAAFLLNRQSTEAGMKFLIIGAISSALMLYGMALVFGFTGSTQLAEISTSIGQATGDMPFGSYALFIGIILMVAGFGFKLSAAPFQMWVPDVYEGAPTPVVAFLSVASKAAAFAVLLRVFFTGFFDVALDWGILIAGLAAASMVIGNLVAISQSNIRRLFGYSTIAHAGYILVGVAAGVKSGEGIFRAPEFAAIGPDSVLFYLAAYAASNLTAFIAITAISTKINSDQISDYAGLVTRAPVLSIIFALSLLALVGVPPTGIFIAKLYIFTAAVDSGLTWLALLGVINSAVSAYYYIRIIRIMFTQPAVSEEKITVSPAPWLALGLAGAAMVFLGIAPGFVMEAAQSAVRALAV